VEESRQLEKKSFMYDREDYKFLAFVLLVVGCLIFAGWGGVHWVNSAEGQAWLKQPPTNGSIALLLIFFSIFSSSGSKKS